MKTRTSEIVWNDTPGSPSGDGTGGGYSTLFPMPAWQIADGAPQGPGRMVPDVAAVADPSTGYEIYYGGSPQVVGGTSAVAPLYAGLLAAAGRKLGFVTDKLWANRGDFVDVTQGDNGMYRAQVGPDPCTGLGVPVGSKIDALLGGGGGTVSPPPPPPPPPVVVVRRADAALWAESALPAHGPLSYHTIKHLIEGGLRSHWPSGATNVQLSDVIAWAESELPHASMTRHAANHYIERGIARHWPKGVL